VALFGEEVGHEPLLEARVERNQYVVKIPA
jgi:hypothetical protein